MPTRSRIAALAASALVVSVGAAPYLARASDHLDAPSLGSVGSDADGNLTVSSTHGDRDLADLYAFQGSDPGRTALVMTSNPAINLFGGKFGPNVRYTFNVDNTGDAVQDLAYVVTFDDGALGNQHYVVTRYTGANAVSLAHGVTWGWGSTAGTGIGAMRGSGRVFAGVRSDPFFFDLAGFEGSVLGVGSARLGGGHDFFAHLNINAIVIEVPDDQLGGKIGVWATTQFTTNGGATWTQSDQVGRPAINTVFNNHLVDPHAGATKDAFNATPPSLQRTGDGGRFRANMIATLTNINAVLGTGHPDYTAAQAGAIADVLLPDVLTYDTSTAASGPLNGRALADDVIDVELGLTTNGSVTSDGVGPHADYRSTFPYLGSPH
jgi:hypothetical protein